MSADGRTKERAIGERERESKNGLWDMRLDTNSCTHCRGAFSPERKNVRVRLCVSQT